MTPQHWILGAEFPQLLLNPKEDQARKGGAFLSASLLACPPPRKPR